MSRSVREVCDAENMKDVKIQYLEADIDITSYHVFRKYVFPKLYQANVGVGEQAT